jgi:hypothetical protein
VSESLNETERLARRVRVKSVYSYRALGVNEGRKLTFCPLSVYMHELRLDSPNTGTSPIG